MDGIARAATVLGLLLALAACGRYGPPRRVDQKPASAAPAAPAASGSAPVAPAAPPNAEPDDDTSGPRTPGTR